MTISIGTSVSRGFVLWCEACEPRKISCWYVWCDSFDERSGAALRGKQTLSVRSCEHAWLGVNRGTRRGCQRDGLHPVRISCRCLSERDSRVAGSRNSAGYDISSESSSRNVLLTNSTRLRTRDFLNMLRICALTVAGATLSCSAICSVELPKQMSVRIRISLGENPRRCEPNAAIRFLMGSAVSRLLDMLEPFKACSTQRQLRPPGEQQLAYNSITQLSNSDMDVRSV